MFNARGPPAQREHVILDWIAQLVLDGTELAELELRDSSWSADNPYGLSESAGGLSSGRPTN